MRMHSRGHGLIEHGPGVVYGVSVFLIMVVVVSPS